MFYTKMNLNLQELDRQVTINELHQSKVILKREQMILNNQKKKKNTLF